MVAISLFGNGQQDLSIHPVRIIEVPKDEKLSIQSLPECFRSHIASA